MTLETMAAACKELNRRGVDASFEYPGFIAVQANGTTIYFGDANETISGDVMSEDLDEVIEVFESSIRSDSANVMLVAEWIASVHAKVSELGGLCVTCKTRCNVEGICPVCEMAENRGRLADLLTQDIYTDAPEYADRVAAVRELVSKVFQLKGSAVHLLRRDKGGGCRRPAPKVRTQGWR